jgi:hypothetical protein
MWAGHYEQSGADYPQRMKLEFADGLIRGDGVDDIGAFVVDGEYRVDAGEVRLGWIKTYVRAAELPVSGRGVLMLEELNRAEIPVMQPALQLLSARRLHADELPPGGSCVAAINPEDGDYQVNRLDPALRSRFLQLSVCAERETWLRWARKANVHPVIARVAQDHADLLEHGSPRSWAYASELLHALRPAELSDRELLRVALRGYLPSSWAILVAEALASYPSTPELDPDAMLAPGGAAELARHVRELESQKRIDAVAMLASKLRRALSNDALRSRVEAGSVTLASLEALVSPRPGRGVPTPPASRTDRSPSRLWSGRTVKDERLPDAAVPLVPRRWELWARGISLQRAVVAIDYSRCAA